MEYQKIVLMVVVVLIVIAVYSIAVSQKVIVGENTTAANDLLIKAMRFGLGEDDYVMSYVEISDGYINRYSLESKGGNKSITVQNPLSVKKAFFLGNETIMCIEYPMNTNESCAYITEEADLQNYVASLSSKFLSDLGIEKNKNDVNYLIENNYLKLNPEVLNRTIEGSECSEISYTVDFSNISLSDAARFGISSSSPKIFDWKMCIDDETGMVYDKYFNYSLDGRMHTYQVNAMSFENDAGEIVKPAELVESITTILYSERGQYVKLAKCYTSYEDAERDDCISDLAITLRMEELCQLAGNKVNICLVSLVPITKNKGICDTITDSFYKDDCYIELAGAYKNSSYCELVMNTSKLAQCNSASTVEQTGG